MLKFHFPKFTFNIGLHGRNLNLVYCSGLEFSNGQTRAVTHLQIAVAGLTRSPLERVKVSFPKVYI